MAFDANKTRIPPHETILRLLDRECADCYPYALRVRLAECAIRHAEGAKSWHGTVGRAIRWLRDTGHISGTLKPTRLRDKHPA